MKELLNIAPYNLSDEEIAWVYDTLGGMSQEDKIRQMFCSIAYTDNEPYLKSIADQGLGGLMCRPMSSGELVNLTRILQENSKIPMFIAGNMIVNSPNNSPNNSANYFFSKAI